MHASLAQLSSRAFLLLPPLLELVLVHLEPSLALGAGHLVVLNLVETVLYGTHEILVKVLASEIACAYGHNDDFAIEFGIRFRGSAHALIRVTYVVDTVFLDIIAVPQSRVRARRRVRGS